MEPRDRVRPRLQRLEVRFTVDASRGTISHLMCIRSSTHKTKRRVAPTIKYGPNKSTRMYQDRAFLYWSSRQADGRYTARHVVTPVK